jgi:hippurate hydrolase
VDTVLSGVRAIESDMVAIRHQIHSNPELSLHEHATSELVAKLLASWGYEVHRGLAGTGVVGTLKLGTGDKRLGIRADMDALPIHETTGLDYASKNPGVMHACGHDGHTAILLTAARHLAETRAFDGTLHLIFQPAEERDCGADIMVKAGLFDMFPCDMVFALHNMPGERVGSFGFLSGCFMASSDTVHITVRGKGGHGANPHRATDPVVAASHVVLALQTIVSRNTDPRDTAIITVGAIHGGEASNVIPDEVKLTLSVRAFDPAIREWLRTRVTEVAQGQAAALQCSAEVDYRMGCPATINNAAATAFARDVASEWLGSDCLIENMRPVTGSEDFSFMLEAVPGCYFIVGNGLGETHATGGCMVHNPGYDFNDEILPIAASYWVRLTERYLRADAS